MSLHSLITIDVDDSAFEAFRERFAEFREAARVSLGIHDPENLHANGHGPGGMPQGDEVIDLLTDIRDAVAKMSEGSNSTGHSDSLLPGSSSGMAAKLVGFLKGGARILGPIGAAIGGYELIKGIASLPGKILEGAGLEDHAHAATAFRSAARGLNTSIGSFRAFQTDLAPYGSGEGLLHSVVNAQNDITNPGNIYLRQHGVSENASADTGAIEVLRGMRQAFLDTRNNPMLLQSTLQTRQLDQFGDAGLAREVGSISDREFSELISKLGQDSKQLNVQDQTAKVWQDMNQSLLRSKASIETVFLDTLPAAAKLETTALDTFSGSLTSLSGRIDKLFPDLTTKVSDQSTPTDLGKGALSDLSPMANFAWDKIKGYLGQTENRKQDPNAVSPAGAIGNYQVEPKTAAGYGLTREDLFDPKKNEYVAQQEWTKLLSKYGDPIKAAAAYNWGQGNLDKSIHNWGSDWKLHLPNETKKYITKTPLGEYLNKLSYSPATPQQPTDQSQPTQYSESQASTIDRSTKISQTTVNNHQLPKVNVTNNDTSNMVHKQPDSPKPVTPGYKARSRDTNLTIRNSTGHDLFIAGRLANRGNTP